MNSIVKFRLEVATRSGKEKIKLRLKGRIQKTYLKSITISLNVFDVLINYKDIIKYLSFNE